MMRGALGAMEVVVIFLSIAVISVCLVARAVWDKVPWWRSHPSPRRQRDDDREHLKAWRIRKHHPAAFADSPLPRPGKTGDG